MNANKEILKSPNYVLRICDVNEREDSKFCFESDSPFPPFNKGDALRTVAWNLGLKGYPVVVEEIQHSIFNGHDHVICETYLYCRFPATAQP